MGHFVYSTFNLSVLQPPLTSVQSLREFLFMASHPLFSILIG